MNSTDFESRKSDRTKASKGDVSIVEVAGRLKVSLPRQYFGGQQIKKALGLKATPENWIKAERIARRIADDLQEGKFDDTLDSYGVKLNIKVVPKSDSLPPKPKLGVLEVWEKYLEYKKPNLKVTTYHANFVQTFTSAIKQAVESVGEDPISIRSWLLSNRCLTVARSVLSHLSKSYQLLRQQSLITCDPFDGMAAELPKKSKNKEVNTYQGDNKDNNLYDHQQVKKKAFTKDEVEVIIEAVKQSKAKHYYFILQFLFLTGCRTNEAVSFMWGDIKWNNEYIVFDRSYSPKLKEFVSTKTGNPRLFPMPKNGVLWNLLKSIPQCGNHELVFKSRSGKIINSIDLGVFWRGTSHKKCNSPGLITTLVSQNKISKYLPLYNTRHTFISYQINECGIPPYVVKDWCGHSEKLTTETYRQQNLLVKPVDYKNESIPEQPSKLSDIEVLKQQMQQLIEQNKMLQEIIVGLETKSKTTSPEPIA